MGNYGRCMEDKIAAAVESRDTRSIEAYYADMEDDYNSDEEDIRREDEHERRRKLDECAEPYAPR